jgi:hypothetical protein
MSGELTNAAADEQRRAAVAAAITRVTELRSAALSTLPERSNGRRRIVEACDAALTSAATAMRGMAVGDDPPGALAQAWQASLDAARRAYQLAEGTVREVAAATERRLSQLWRVTVEQARQAKQAVADTLSRAVTATRDAVEAAYRYAVDTASKKLGIAVVLLGLAAIYFLRK